MNILNTRCPRLPGTKLLHHPYDTSPLPPKNYLPGDTCSESSPRGSKSAPSPSSALGSALLQWLPRADSSVHTYCIYDALLRGNVGSPPPAGPAYHQRREFESVVRPSHVVSPHC